VKDIKDRRRGLVAAELFEGNSNSIMTENFSKSYYSYLDRNKKLAPVSKQLSKERRFIL